MSQPGMYSPLFPFPQSCHQCAQAITAIQGILATFSSYIANPTFPTASRNLLIGMSMALNELIRFLQCEGKDNRQACIMATSLSAALQQIASELTVVTPPSVLAPFNLSLVTAVATIINMNGVENPDPHDHHEERRCSCGRNH